MGYGVYQIGLVKGEWNNFWTLSEIVTTNLVFSVSTATLCGSITLRPRLRRAPRRAPASHPRGPIPEAYHLRVGYVDASK